MIATQGPQTDGIEVTSTPGRTGNYGWTDREKMLRPAAAGAVSSPVVISAPSTPAAPSPPSPAPQG